MPRNLRRPAILTTILGLVVLLTAATQEAKYLWSFVDNRIQFTPVGTDDCQARRDGLVGMVWTRG
jgi:hypothetical protein